MKKSEVKQKLVQELTDLYNSFDVIQLYNLPRQEPTRSWIANIASILKNLDEGDYQEFIRLSKTITPTEQREKRKSAAYEIDAFIRRKVAEYKRYDFGYLDREIKDNPEDISNYIHDKELRDRCLDLLMAASKYDRAINQATQVLEDRIRVKSEVIERLQGVSLVNRVLNSDINKTILKVSNDPDEHQGFCDICRGIMLTFRNPTHHYLSDKITREDAFKVCVFIDTLLPIIERSSKVSSSTEIKSQMSKEIRKQKRDSSIKISLLDGKISWANYGIHHYVFSSFSAHLIIDNYESDRPDYISAAIEASSANGDWVGNHFIFEGVNKPDEELRVEASEVKKSNCIYI